MATESSLRRRFREHLPEAVRLMRVENRAHPGTPDIYICDEIKRTAWIELKSRPAPKSRSDFIGLKLRKDQVLWHRTFGRCTNSWVLIQVGSSYLLIPSYHSSIDDNRIHVRDATQFHLDRLSHSAIYRMLS